MDLRETPPGKSEFLWLVVILTVGLFLRIVTVSVLDLRPESDYAAYQAMALNLLAGKGIVDTMGNLAMYNVGYPLFILAPVFSLFHNSLLAVQIVNALLGVTSIVICFIIAREIGAGPAGRLVAPAFMALYLPSWVYAEYLAKENLMTPLMLGVVWCSLRLARNCSLGFGVACGLLLGLLALTGNAALCLSSLVLIALVSAPGVLGRKLSITAVIAVSALTVVLPWLIRNYKVLGAPLLNTNGGFNLYLGNNPAATGYFVSISDTPRGPNWEALRREGERQSSETLGREAVTWIMENPTEFVTLALKKALLFWMPPGHEGKGPSSPLEHLIRQLYLTQFVILVVGALGTAVLPDLWTRGAAFVWIAIASYTVVHMVFYVIFRYREPIMPLLCILAALTIENLFIRFRPVSRY